MLTTFQHNLKQIVRKWRQALFAGDDRSGNKVNLRLARQRAAVSYHFSVPAGIAPVAGAVLIAKGQRLARSALLW